MFGQEDGRVWRRWRRYGRASRRRTGPNSERGSSLSLCISDSRCLRNNFEYVTLCGAVSCLFSRFIAGAGSNPSPKKMRKKRSKRRRCKQAAILSLASTPGSSPEKGAGPEPSDKGSAPDEGAAGTDAPAGGEAADANRRGRRARRNRHSGRPAQPASANARTDSSKTTKRKRQIWKSW